MSEQLSYLDVKDIKDKAKIAKSINWHKVMDMMLKFNQPSPMIMAIKYDIGELPDVKPKPYPFHSHYRKNLEKMILSGCFNPKQADKLILYAKSLKIDKDVGPEEEVE